MFWILEIFPDWFWWLLLIAGLSGYFLCRLIPLQPQQQLIKIVSCISIALSIFIFGILHSNNTWKARVAELQAQAITLQAQSTQTNATINTKVVTRTQLIRERGADIVTYVDREIVKYDAGCVIPQEFIRAHNSAAEPVK